MKRYLGCGLGLLMIASSFPTLASPVMGVPPSIAKSLQAGKAKAPHEAALRAKAQQDKPCPIRRS